MKIFLRSALVALGATTIYINWIIVPLISPTHLAIYHWEGPASAIFLPTLLDFVALWLLLTSLLLMAQRPGRLSAAVWSGVIVVIPWLAFKNFLLISAITSPHWISRVLFTLSVVAWLLFAVFWRPSLQPPFERVRHFSATLLSFMAIVGSIFLGQLMWFAWQTRALNAAIPLHRQLVCTAPAVKPRIVWIIFDELSYQQVYGQRFPGLQLPAFDALASQSTIFTHAIPAGYRTDIVVPSLFTGEPLDRMRSSSDGRRLSIHNSRSQAWEEFNQHRTVFQDALNAGYSTAVAGWTNPYCRILPEVLDRCFWTEQDYSLNFMLPYGPVSVNMLEPLIRMTGVEKSPLSLLRATSINPVQAYGFHITDYREIVTAADRLLEDRSINFIFLHLPVPHPDGIYNRKTGELSNKRSTYLDNLALADRCLAHIRSILERSGEWDSTAVVVMGDHSWRTKVWNLTSLWTEEEETASHGGQFDDRPAYVVKLPGQQAAAQITVPIAAVDTRLLLDGIITHSILSSSDLAAWSKHPDR